MALDNKDDPNNNTLGSQNEDGQIIKGKFVRNHGMSWIVAALFLVGDIAGVGIVSLPTAIQQASFYVGLIICLIMAVIATASAIFLGKSWEILLRNWSIYRSHCRKPYAEIGFRAFGTNMMTYVSVCLNITQFGLGVVLILLSSKNIADFISTFTSNGPGLCLLIPIIAVILLPFTFLKSPEDFWWSIVASMIATCVALVLIIIGMIRDYPTCSQEAKEPKFHTLNFLTALGTMVFTYGGHSTFPTVQHDMRRASEFSRSAIVAFIIVTLLYAPVVILSHLTYGDSLRESLINSIQTTWIRQTINLMIAAHCMFVLALMFNPLNQQAEEFFNVPHQFGPKRVILRTSIMIGVVFVSESVPSFGSVLNLIGSSTFTLTCIIFPSLFYLFLSARENKAKEQSRHIDDVKVTFKEMMQMTDKRILVFCSFIVVIGIIGGIAGTFSSIRDITTTHFEVPCYVRPFIKNVQQNQSKSINCCGSSQMISVWEVAENVCNDPDIDFYKP